MAESTIEAGGSSVDDEMLMNHIQNYRVIYDKTCKGYKNRTTKRNAWEEVAKKFSMSVDECQRRYNTIRTRYSKYLKQHRAARKTGTGRDDVPKIRKEYEYLRWLTVHIKHREGTSNYKMEHEADSDADEAQRSSSKDDVDCDDQSVGDDQSDSTFTTSTDDMLLSMYDTETVKKKMPRKSHSPDYSVRKKNKLTNAEIDQQLLHTMSQINQAIKHENATKSGIGDDDDDEDKLFCLSLVKQLKNMNPQEKSQVKIDILKAFCPPMIQGSSHYPPYYHPYHPSQDYLSIADLSNTTE